MWRELFHSLGLVPAEKRSVKPIPESLRALVPKPTDNNVTVKPSTPDVERDTMPLIIDKCKRTLYQTKKLAAKLKGATLAETLRNDSDFILKYIRYKKDDPQHEQIRSPRRLVADACGDCDCFAVFLASVLQNQGIKFQFRIAKYANSNGQWSHIYIVVPKDQRNASIELYDRSQYTVLDPVTNLHDHEVTYKQKRDYTMSLQYLDGISPGYLSACQPETIVEKSIAEIGKLREYVDNETIRMQGLVPTEEFLQNNNIAFTHKVNPENNSGYLMVDTPNGAIGVKTIITKEQATQLVQELNKPVIKPDVPAVAVDTEKAQPTPTALQPVATTAKADVPWWSLIMIAGTALSAMKSNGTGHGVPPGLAGVPKKRRVVHI